MSLHLLLIDCQNDFVLPKEKGGALPVGGAEGDMERLAVFIRSNASKIDAIHATLDSHRTIHIAHPIWWTNSSDEHPTPFTYITKEDVNSSKWMANDIAYQDYSIEYVNKLGGMVVWPPHCLIGSEGHAIVKELHEALQFWEKKTLRTVNYVHKGSNIKTEHFSIIRACVPDPNDPTTETNKDLIECLRPATKILAAGEASSHCVADSLTDLSEFAEKIVLLKDCTSPVSGYEHLEEKFISNMTARGMTLSTAKDFKF